MLTRLQDPAEDIAQEAKVAVHGRFEVLDEPLGIPDPGGGGGVVVIWRRGVASHTCLASSPLSSSRGVPLSRPVAWEILLSGIQDSDIAWRDV